MRQAIVAVDWLLFPEDARAVEKRLRAHPGIARADINPITQDLPTLEFRRSPAPAFPAPMP
ncbi:MAG: hypothetical protein HY321_05875 [Armatimonadetes bacterium]|nr:hypothetical protein [Armatimonadota bacterium]